MFGRLPCAAVEYSVRLSWYGFLHSGEESYPCIKRRRSSSADLLWGFLRRASVSCVLQLPLTCTSITVLNSVVLLLGLPGQVRVEASASESRSEGTVVYIDKPLVKRRMTLREKNTLFYKHALHHVGTHSGRGNVLDLGKKPAHARTPVDESLPSASSQPAEPPQVCDGTAQSMRVPLCRTS